MEKVLGVGGFFYRARDAAALMAWYETHLGLTAPPQTYEEPCWRQNGGATVFSPFAQDTDYFRDPAKQWMINFRVRDLKAMVRQLEAAGVTVEVDPEEYPNGFFARLEDPEGNPVQLWQPTGRSLEDEEQRG